MPLRPDTLPSFPYLSNGQLIAAVTKQNFRARPEVAADDYAPVRGPTRLQRTLDELGAALPGHGLGLAQGMGGDAQLRARSFIQPSLTRRGPSRADLLSVLRLLLAGGITCCLGVSGRQRTAS